MLIHHRGQVSTARALAKGLYVHTTGNERTLLLPDHPQLKPALQLNQGGLGGLDRRTPGLHIDVRS